MLFRHGVLLSTVDSVNRLSVGCLSPVRMAALISAVVVSLDW
ncbi:hypothetical protein RISK_000819 [Rhodopirellula islandica]|uniref:Uncharacterized protein n=1 Tax=Rhodopirellula islandica TaxID=595434 RepID=A0A0J1BKR7_RHOIS|nr:hypothetical protein RISK_000819 [Rhodopirellula islandica]